MVVDLKDADSNAEKTPQKVCGRALALPLCTAGPSLLWQVVLKPVYNVQTFWEVFSALLSTSFTSTTTKRHFQYWRFLAKKQSGTFQKSEDFVFRLKIKGLDVIKDCIRNRSVVIN
jgi:hypothetical protein